MEVERVPAAALGEALGFLERTLRGGAPVSEDFAAGLRAAVERGDTEIIAARSDGCAVGVAVLEFRLNISAGGLFASVEEVQVAPDAGGRGVGRALIEAAKGRCAERGVSYLEVQTDDEAAGFYRACGFEPEPEVRVLSLTAAPFA